MGFRGLFFVFKKKILEPDLYINKNSNSMISSISSMLGYPKDSDKVSKEMRQ